MRKLKVFGGLTFHRGKQVSTVVATTSQKRAAELVGIPLSILRAYWSETGNKHAVEAALSKPDTVFVASSSMGHDFKPLVEQ